MLTQNNNSSSLDQNMTGLTIRKIISDFNEEQTRKFIRHHDNELNFWVTKRKDALRSSFEQVNMESEFKTFLKSFETQYSLFGILADTQPKLLDTGTFILSLVMGIDQSSRPVIKMPTGTKLFELVNRFSRFVFEDSIGLSTKFSIMAPNRIRPYAQHVCGFITQFNTHVLSCLNDVSIIQDLIEVHNKLNEFRCEVVISSVIQACKEQNVASHQTDRLQRFLHDYGLPLQNETAQKTDNLGISQCIDCETISPVNARLKEKRIFFDRFQSTNNVCATVLLQVKDILVALCDELNRLYAVLASDPSQSDRIESSIEAIQALFKELDLMCPSTERLGNARATMPTPIHRSGTVRTLDFRDPGKITNSEQAVRLDARWDARFEPSPSPHLLYGVIMADASRAVASVHTEGQGITAEGFHMVLGPTYNSLAYEIDTMAASWLVTAPQSSLQTGNEWVDGPDSGKIPLASTPKEEKLYRKMIKFSSRFERVPEVACWLYDFDLISDQPKDDDPYYRLRVFADEITREGFHLNVHAWLSCSWRSVGVSWCAGPPSKGVSMGTRETTGWKLSSEQPWVTDVSFPEDAFRKAPDIVYGLSHIDTSACLNGQRNSPARFVFNIEHSSLSEKGVKFTTTTWGGSNIFALRLSYLALREI